MPYDTHFAPAARSSFKILVIDEDATTANTIGTVLARDACEIIACRDMALAEVATDLTEFDLILVAPDSTGVDGVEGLAVANFLVARNPTAVTAVMVSQTDGDLKAVMEKVGAFEVLTKPLLLADFISLSTRLGIHLAPTVSA